MEERHIPLEQLHISKLNMRYGRKSPDVSDILPSIREKGILLPLIVRPEDGSFGVVAGGRRYRCGEIIKEERGAFDPPRCVIMTEGDDAEAIEVSLIENFARRDPDPFSEYETFAKLIKCGRTIEGIAATFGITPQTVKQRLALANLLPKIKEAYRAEEIDDETVQHLTMATKSQQKEWLKLFEDEDGNAPTGRSLKQWLFGGASISTAAALFPLEEYTGEIVNDLFGEESYFANAETFWEAQSAAIEAKAESYREAGWSKVVILDVGAYFSTWDHEKAPKKKGGKVYWDHEKAPKKKGGKVYVEIAHNGSVKFNEGWLTKKEVQKAARSAAKEGGETEAEKPAPAKPLERDTVAIFAHLLTLTDADVMRIAAFVMADTLAVGDTPVEAVGLHLKVNAVEVWQADDVFFEMIRDRATINAMLIDVAGKSIAKANAEEKAKTQKKVIRDCLAGENARPKVEGWLAGWMQFPFKPYGKGACGIANAAKQAAKALPAG